MYRGFRGQWIGPNDTERHQSLRQFWVWWLLVFRTVRMVEELVFPAYCARNRSIWMPSNARTVRNAVWVGVWCWWSSCHRHKLNYSSCKLSSASGFPIGEAENSSEAKLFAWKMWTYFQNNDVISVLTRPAQFMNIIIEVSINKSSYQ